MLYTKKEIDCFSQAVESLKKYRRADLIDEAGKNLLDVLYTDLLPNDHILNKCLLDNTTFLIGRKGTGKSTLFLKMERELRRKKSYLPCYIDVKTIYESSQAQAIDYEHLKEYLSQEVLEKYFLERTFIQNVLKAIKLELTQKYNSIFERTIGKIVGTKAANVKEKITNLNNRIDNNEHLKEIEIPVIKQSNISASNNMEEQKSSSKTRGGEEVNATLKVDSLTLGIKNNSKSEASSLTKDVIGKSTQFSEIFLKVFEIKDTIAEIQQILKALEIRHLVVLLDDLSEIDDDAIRTFIDTIVAPLNNWSEEFIKFKIAAYPNRIHYGKIDPGKVDTINLDFYNIYSEFDRNKMEEYAVDFTKRLLEKRIIHFTQKDPEYFFDTSRSKINEYYELLFQVSMNVPRIMGYILSYCHQNRIIFQKQITKTDIELAAEKYFNEKIDTFFHTSTYCLMSLNERISIFQLNELKNLLVDKLLEIKKRITTGDLKGKIYLPIQPYSSHFHVYPNLENFLKTLELNHFISKYDELSDKDGNLVYIYCINYGLAKKNNIFWGKPKGTEYRKYFIERPFNFSKVIKDYMSTTKKIQCTNSACKKLFRVEDLPFLEFNNNKCNTCGSLVSIESLSEQVINEITKIDERKLLPKQDLSIIIELYNSDNELKYAREIAEELDYSKNVIANRCKVLDQKHGLIERVKLKDNDPYKYRLTEKAIEQYIAAYTR
jgi:hypothetical protein